MICLFYQFQHFGISEYFCKEYGKNFSFPIHLHQSFEFITVTDGEMTITIDTIPYHLKKGDILLINPLELHQPRIGPDQHSYERIVLWINKNYLAHLCSNKTSLSRCFDNANPDHTNLLSLTREQQEILSDRLNSLLREAGAENYGSDLASKAILTSLLVELNRICIAGQSSKKNDKDILE